MGLAKKAIDVSTEIQDFLGKINTASQPDFSILAMKGNMLLAKADMIYKDLIKAGENEEIRITALQLAEGIKIQTGGLKDVVDSLQAADRKLVLANKAVLEKQIMEIKEKGKVWEKEERS